MNHVTLLREALRPYLTWHGARLSFLATFLIALLQVKTVNFAELASAFGGKAHIDSHYKRAIWRVCLQHLEGRQDIIGRLQEEAIKGPNVE